MKILVTGGAGFIGSHLVDELIKKGHQVTIFDSLDPQVHPNSKKPEFINKEAEFLQGDVRDYESLKKAIGDNEIIFHQAAAVGVGQSQYQIKHYIEVNTQGTANLLDILVNEKKSIKKLIVASSMSCYGEGKYQISKTKSVRPPLRSEKQMEQKKWELFDQKTKKELKSIGVSEEDEFRCSSIYAQSKRDQEEMCLNIGQTYNIPTVALRYFNVYGPRQSLSNPYTGVAAIFLSRLKSNKPPIVYEDGLQSRDFVSVHDIVQANILAMEKDEANFQSFNVGTGKKVTILDVANTLSKLLNKNIKPEITHQFRKGDIRHCFSDITKIKNELGYNPKVSFENGMKELIIWSDSAAYQDKFDQVQEELKSKGLV